MDKKLKKNVLHNTLKGGNLILKLNLFFHQSANLSFDI